MIIYSIYQCDILHLVEFLQEGRGTLDFLTEYSRRIRVMRVIRVVRVIRVIRVIGVIRVINLHQVFRSLLLFFFGRHETRSLLLVTSKVMGGFERGSLFFTLRTFT